MYAVFFEMRPHPGHLEHYFEHVAQLRPALVHHTGLAYLERFSSLRESDLILSHQLWESEEAITAWRANENHRSAQAAGRQVHFADYRIRVGGRVLHWQGGPPTTLPAVAAGADSPHILALYGTRPMPAPEIAVFKSVSRNERFIGLVTANGFLAAEAILNAQIASPGLEEVAIFCISRDYGQFDRTQAPD